MKLVTTTNILLLQLFFITNRVITIQPATSSPNLRLEWTNEICPGEDRGLLSTGLSLSYTSNSTDESGDDMQSYSCSIWVDFNYNLTDLTYYEGTRPRNISSMTFEFEQPEHGGGKCHCFVLNYFSNSNQQTRRYFHYYLHL